MRVRINYAVEVEEVLQEVERIVQASSKRLRSKINKLDQSCAGLQDEDTEEAIEDIISLRKELARHDQALDDCYAILQGYIGLLDSSLQPNNPEEGDSDEPPQTKDG
jgi:hypothetical protein